MSSEQLEVFAAHAIRTTLTCSITSQHFICQQQEGRKMMLKARNLLLLVAVCWLNAQVVHEMYKMTNLADTAPAAHSNTLASDQPNQECCLLDGRGNPLTKQLMPPDGTAIFSITVFGEARVPNVMHMLTKLLANDEQPESRTNFPHMAMIAVSGNETLLPLLLALNSSSLTSTVLIAELAQDFGPISRVVATDSCFSPSTDYTFVVGDDDMFYNPRAVFDELPDNLRQVQQRLNTSTAMLGYAGLEWNYPIQWGGFLKGAQFNSHVAEGVWKQYRDTSSRTATFCMDSLEPSLLTETSSLCNNIIQTGILECYGLIAFHRSAVNPRLYKKHHHPNFLQPCFWGDDFWLAYYAFRMNISMYVLKSRVGNTAWFGKLPQPDGSVGDKSGIGGGNIGNYRHCEKAIVDLDIQNNCSWCI